MKNLVKALKLYLKISFNPIVSTFGILIMVALLIAGVLSPETPESEDYMSMAVSAGFVQIGIAAVFLTGSVSMARNKCYASLPFAKALYTAAPAVASGAVALIYDVAAVTVAALCWSERGLSDILDIAPLNSFMICLAVACIGKQKLEWVYLICVMFLAFEEAVLPNISLTAHGLGLPLTVSAVIGALIFVLGMGLTLVITDIWWKNCDHTYRSSTYIRNR